MKRVPPLRTWLVIAVLLGIAVFLKVSEITGHPGLDNIVGAFLILLSFMLLLFWFSFRSDYPKELRWGAFTFVILGIVLFNVIFRLTGFTGDMRPIFRNRFTPLPDQTLTSSSTLLFKADLAATTPDDFPQFLGPKRDLVLSDVHLEPDWSAEPPTPIWRQKIGAAWSAFAAVNGYAVTMEQRGPDEMITCYEIKTGKLCWSHALPTRYETVLGGIGPRATPTIHGGKVYALGGTGWLGCLDGATGKLLWKKNLLHELNKPEDEESSDLPFGRANSPLIVDDLVVVPGGGPSGKRVSLTAFHKDTGDLVWQGGKYHIGYSSPVLANVAGREQILNVTEGHVLGHDPKTGKVLWEFEWEGHSNTDATNSQAVPVGDDKVFVSRGYGGGAALFQVIQNKDGTFATKLIYHNRGVLRTKFTNVAMKDGYVYGLSEGTLECVKADTGKRAWKGGRYEHGQILLAGEHLIVLSEQGACVLVEATPERTNNVLGEFQALDGKTWNNIALSGPYLLVRNAEESACYRLKLKSSARGTP